MKLLIDSKNQKVLFAEASKPVIDFLFNLLCLPVGTVVRLLNEKGMVGSLGNLYQSVANLNTDYMVPSQDKDVLLKPKAPLTSSEIAGLLPANDAGAGDTQGSSLFMCPGRCSNYVTYDKNIPCPQQCGRIMNTQLHCVGKNLPDKGISIKGGFVKEIVTFMVMDDLVIEPMSTISSITLLNKFNIREVGSLHEKVVELGMDEGVKLLKASLQCKTVLTSVFLKKNME
ncbi:uncharacterized protein LOC130720033 [Lotus japonicus]|uniref:uncharacterized protein LOC130720033 n=1 Tax=Lotus japonicus TaxID=34305 RepID=UPI00258BE7E6|nr:uncharacterized protein LOC130720033 [Lotus japonicus]